MKRKNKEREIRQVFFWGGVYKGNTSGGIPVPMGCWGAKGH